ncbi:hypothetical protein [Kordia jejudonensis]|uniref:hypothetical protein n=1 Tax=Kordia jejudonensis TaxID=1348245 RepID=UPI0012E06D71|nr:hypothetical protein [Kordia jejudonensis]
MKQGNEDFDFVKDENKEQGNYIFQKNKKTKIAFFFIAAVLAILIFAVALTMTI